MDTIPQRRFGSKNIGRTVTRILAFSLFVCALLGGHAIVSAQAPAKRPYPQEISRVTFAVAGDVIPHQAVTQAAAAAASAPAASNASATNGWDALFANVANAFRQADFGFVNLETPVAPAHSIGSKPFQFDAPVALLQALKDSGVKIVSFANNHVFDQRYTGFDETLQHLREQGLLFVGSGDTAESSWKPVILEKNGIKIGWLGMTRWLNGNRNPDKTSEPHVAFFPYPGESNGAPGMDEPAVLDAIRSARAQCDLLLILIHWGIEYATAPRPEDVDLAHDMLEAGASAVIGHHPHVLQPIETYVTKDQRNTLIVFSLGNFLSNQSSSYLGGLAPDKNGEPRDSLIARFSVVKRDYGPAGIRFELADMGIMPVWTENNRLRVRSGKAKTLFIGPVFMDREIPQLQAKLDELDRLGTQLTNAQKQELAEVSSRLTMLKHRRELLLARTGDDYLVPPPASTDPK